MTTAVLHKAEAALQKKKENYFFQSPLNITWKKKTNIIKSPWVRPQLIRRQRGERERELQEKRKAKKGREKKGADGRRAGFVVSRE